MKSDQLPFGLWLPGLAEIGEQVIHTGTHSKWGQLWMTRRNSGAFVKKIRDLFRKRVSGSDCLFFDQSHEQHGIHGLERMANTLSTEAPTEFGGNLAGAVEKR